MSKALIVLALSALVLVYGGRTALQVGAHVNTVAADRAAVLESL